MKAARGRSWPRSSDRFVSAHGDPFELFEFAEEVFDQVRHLYISASSVTCPRWSLIHNESRAVGELHPWDAHLAVARNGLLPIGENILSRRPPNRQQATPPKLCHFAAAGECCRDQAASSIGDCSGACQVSSLYPRSARPPRCRFRQLCGRCHLPLTGSDGTPVVLRKTGTGISLSRNRSVNKIRSK
jgi:hypothetical protein